MTRFDEIASIASAVLFSKVLVTVSMPADAISIGTRLGMGRVHERQADVVLAQQLSVGPLIGTRQQFEVDSAPRAIRRPRLTVPIPCSSQPP